MATDRLDMCDPGRGNAESFVARHFADLTAEKGSGDSLSSSTIRGGQVEADRQLARLDLDGYAASRSQAYPQNRRGSSRLSPYIRHGLLDLPTVWRSLDGPAPEVERFRLELLWQEYARHLYARLGSRLTKPLNGWTHRRTATTAGNAGGAGWDQAMGCVEITTGELEDDGWLVGQTRLWLASQWTVRQGGDWRQGENYFFRHLIDGSRAANLLGWQTAVGATTGRPYQFTRWQVEARAPGLCASCELNANCPIDRPPASTPIDGSRSGHRPPDDEASGASLASDADVAVTAGPDHPVGGGADVVWLTAESMGDADPALSANPDLPAVFVFDRALLARLRLSSKRLVFLVETLADLATRRTVEVHLGNPVDVLADRRVAVTFTPVPGWRRYATRISPVEVHPWPWLHRPGHGDISSFDAWRRQLPVEPDSPAAEPEPAGSGSAPFVGDFTLPSRDRTLPVAVNMG